MCGSDSVTASDSIAVFFNNFGDLLMLDASKTMMIHLPGENYVIGSGHLRSPGVLGSPPSGLNNNGYSKLAFTTYTLRIIPIEKKTP